MREVLLRAVDKAAEIRWQSTLLRLGPYVGTPEEYMGRDPPVETGTRTISVEVVTALIDGLLSTGFGSEGTTAYKIRQIYSLKEILEHDNAEIAAKAWNSVTLRLLESQQIDPEEDPKWLEEILALLPVPQKDRGMADTAAAQAPVPSKASNMNNRSTAMSSLLYRTLHAFALQGNIKGARRVFARAQSLLIDSSNDSSESFVQDLEQQPSKSVNDEYFDLTSRNFSDCNLNVPDHVLAALIELTIDSQAYDFGRWLMNSGETGGLNIDFSNPNLAPALLRFAVATSDLDLVDRVASALTPPMSESTVRTILHCQIVLNNWDAVEELFEYLKDTPELGWTAAEAMELAGAVMRLESATPVAIQGNSLSPHKFAERAKAIFRKLLHGNYNTVYKAHELRDRSQMQLLSQIIRVFESVPGVLQGLCHDLPANVLQHSKGFDIPVQAFNTLLAAVVDTHGSVEGKRIWDLWCKDPEPISRSRRSGGGIPRSQRTWPAGSLLQPGDDQSTTLGARAVITPDLFTLRTIVRVAIQERKGGIESGTYYLHVNPKAPTSKQYPAERIYRAMDVLEWAPTMFRKFGLREADIHSEMGGYYRRQIRFLDKRLKWVK